MGASSAVARRGLIARSREVYGPLCRLDEALEPLEVLAELGFRGSSGGEAGYPLGLAFPRRSSSRRV